MRGFWIATRTVLPLLRRLISTAGAKALRPAVIRSCGHGGVRGSASARCAASGSGHHAAGRYCQSRRGRLYLTTGSTPTASAMPTHWLVMPCLSSHTTHVSGQVVGALMPRRGR